MNEELDPSIVALTKAIAKQESNNTYNAPKGKDGEHGAYQMTPNFIRTYAPQHLGNEYDENNLTPEQQDRLAYGVIKDWGTQGLTAAQIASKWNSGDENAYKRDHRGISKGGAVYDTPKYVDNVEKAFNDFSGQQYPLSISKTPEPQNTEQTTTVTQDGDQTLGQELGGRAKKVWETIKQDVGGSAEGKVNPITAGVHLGLGVAGQAAGAVGDVTGAALNFLTGGLLHKGEKYVGEKISDLIKTPEGKAVVGKWEEFAKNHPYIADEIGDVANIATIIPALKGFSVLKTGTSGLIKNVTGSSVKNISKDIMGDVTETTLNFRGKVVPQIGDDIKEAAKIIKENVPGYERAKTFTDKALKVKDTIKLLDENPPIQSVDFNQYNKIRETLASAYETLNKKAIAEIGTRPNSFSARHPLVTRMLKEGTKKTVNTALNAAGLGGAYGLYQRFSGK